MPATKPVPWRQRSAHRIERQVWPDGSCETACSLHQLLAVAEGYPELRAGQNCLSLQGAQASSTDPSTLPEERPPP